MADWTKLADDKTLNETVKNVKARGINVVVVGNKKEALEKIKKLIPKNVDVAVGSSTTLNEIGFIGFLESGSYWKSWNKKVISENNDEKRNTLRRMGVTADYFLGSVNAVSKNGELVACDASGSRVTAYPFAAKNLILVAGIQKITDSLEKAMLRVREYAYPLEDKRAKKAYGMSSTIGKWVIIEREIIPGRITLILVKERLGF